MTSIKVKNQKKAILTHSRGPQRNLKQLFLVLTPSIKSFEIKIGSFYSLTQISFQCNL
jgi:hypothetical protein